MDVQLPIEAKDIQKLIPHRYPFLQLDRITVFEPMKTLTAIKNVTMNEPQFQGHFPDLPVMPGVLIIEAWRKRAAHSPSSAKAAAKKTILLLRWYRRRSFQTPSHPRRPTGF